MLKNKALIIDLDGTAIDIYDVVGSKKQLLPSKRLKYAISLAKQNGYYVCIATGRPWGLTDFVAEFLDITDPCIVAAGTHIIDPPTSKVTWQANINKDALIKIKKSLIHFNLKCVFNDFSYEDYINGGFNPDKLDTKKDYNYILAISIIPEDAREIIDFVSNIQGISYTLGLSLNEGRVDLNFTDKSATKEHTVAKLLEEIGVKKENSWGFGDGHNDVHLFNAVGHKIAMGNAVPELKEIADEVIGTVKEDGLAIYFENLAKQM